MLTKLAHPDLFGTAPEAAFERLAQAEGLDGSALLATVRLVRASARVLAVLASLAEEAQLPDARWRVLLTLALLAPSEGLRAGELSDQLRVSQATVTRLIDPLVRDGLVDRVRSPHDRRVVRLSLSESGRARVVAVLPKLDARSRALVRGLGGVEATAEVTRTLASALPS